MAGAKVGDVCDLPEAARPAFCMVECAEGQFPVLRLFSTLEGLVERMQSLEGRDVAVWPFWGVPLPFSQGPNRVLILPDDQAITIDKRQRVVDIDEDDIILQEDGFLGLPELSIAPPSYVKEDEERAAAMQEAAANAAVDDDEDDDDEALDPA
jgi:hypothetical protein